MGGRGQSLPPQPGISARPPHPCQAHPKPVAALRGPTGPVGADSRPQDPPSPSASASRKGPGLAAVGWLLASGDSLDFQPSVECLGPSRARPHEEREEAAGRG